MSRENSCEPVETPKRQHRSAGNILQGMADKGSGLPWDYYPTDGSLQSLFALGPSRVGE